MCVSRKNSKLWLWSCSITPGHPSCTIFKTELSEVELLTIKQTYKSQKCVSPAWWVRSWWPRYPLWTAAVGVSNWAHPRRHSLGSLHWHAQQQNGWGNVQPSATHSGCCRALKHCSLNECSSPDGTFWPFSTDQTSPTQLYLRERAKYREQVFSMESKICSFVSIMVLIVLKWSLIWATCLSVRSMLVYAHKRWWI